MRHKREEQVKDGRCGKKYLFPQRYRTPNLTCLGGVASKTTRNVWFKTITDVIYLKVLL